MSTIIIVADAVAASLNAGSFSQTFTAARHYQPSFELSDMQALRVSVVPKSVSIASATRQHSFFDFAIDIGVQQKINTNDPVEIDALMDLMDEIADHLRLKRLDGLPEAAWLSIGHEPVFAAEHLDQQRLFTSVLTVTYRIRK